MARLIINYPNGMDTRLALEYAAKVVEQGRISKHTRNGFPIDHFCWATTFNNAVVFANPRKRANSADSLTIKETTWLS